MKFELKTAVNRLEDAIITISGPALAISGIIAGVDLVTGGNALRNVPWLTLIWAICLLLTLDFQVLALGARAHKVYLSTNKATGRKVFEIALACLVAAGVSYVSIQMQSIIARANVAAISIDQAAAQMGINTIALIWERSALVLVLIFLSGWFREDEHEKTPQLETAEAAINPEVLNVLVEKLETLSITVNQLTNPSLPALPATAPEAESGQADSVSETRTEQVQAILQETPDASVRDVAHAIGRSKSTAHKAIKAVKQQKE